MTNPDPRDLLHSRRLDVHCWSDHPEANEFVDAIVKQHFADFTHRRTRQHLKVLLLQLYVAWAEDPTLCIAVGMSSRAYKALSRYNEIHVSNLMIDVVHRLHDAGLIEKRTGWQDPETKKGFLTRIWPSRTLIKMFEVARFGPLDIGSQEERECIVLREKFEPTTQAEADDSNRVEKATTKDIEYEDNQDTRRMRAAVRAYNALLRKTFVDIPQLEQPRIKWVNDQGKQRKLAVGQSQKFVRRIFSRKRWDMNGRFYGGWWQSAPEEWRMKIRLNDEICLEEDFSALHPIMLYALQGKDYWATGGGDPYAIEFTLAKDAEEARKWAKTLFLVTINASNEKKAFKAFRHEMPNGSNGKQLSNEQLTGMLDELRSKHSLIADYLCQDVGVKLMNLDGQITERLIEWFTRLDVPILTIHDSYVAPRLHLPLLRGKMNQAFEEVMGIGRVHTKTSGYDPKAFSRMLNSLDKDFVHFELKRISDVVKEHSDSNRHKTRGYVQRYKCFVRWQQENAEASHQDETDEPTLSVDDMALVERTE